MIRYARTLKYMIANGYGRDAALTVIRTTYCLTTEQVEILDRLTRPDLPRS